MYQSSDLGYSWTCSRTCGQLLQ